MPLNVDKIQTDSSVKLNIFKRQLHNSYCN